jgi:hypothetical protein
MKNEEHEDLTRVAQTATATTVALPQSGNEPKSRTPGPWQVDPDDLMPNHPLGVAVEGPNGVWVSDHSSLQDAYLIAAAPDLYLAAKRFLEVYGPCDDECGCTGDLMARAVAKAEGR